MDSLAFPNHWVVNITLISFYGKMNAPIKWPYIAIDGKGTKIYLIQIISPLCYRVIVDDWPIIPCRPLVMVDGIQMLLGAAVKASGDNPSSG